MNTASHRHHERRRMLAGVRTAVIVCGFVTVALAAHHLGTQEVRPGSSGPTSAVASPVAAPADALAAMDPRRSIAAFVGGDTPRMIDGAPPETSQVF